MIRVVVMDEGKSDEQTERPCKAPWGLRLRCEFVHLTDCETTG